MALKIYTKKHLPIWLMKAHWMRIGLMKISQEAYYSYKGKVEHAAHIFGHFSIQIQELYSFSKAWEMEGINAHLQKLSFVNACIQKEICAFTEASF